MKLPKSAIDFFLTVEELSEYTGFARLASSAVLPESLLQAYDACQSEMLGDVGAPAMEFLVTKVGDFQVEEVEKSFNKLSSHMYVFLQADAYWAYLTDIVTECLEAAGKEAASRYCGAPVDANLRGSVEELHSRVDLNSIRSNLFDVAGLDLFPEEDWHLKSARRAMELRNQRQRKGIRPSDLRPELNGGLTFDDVANMPRGLACAVVESGRAAVEHSGVPPVDVPQECIGSVEYAAGEIHNSLLNTKGAQVLVRRSRIGRELGGPGQ